ncbi:MAG TPA: cation diffusion facilitator family transporter, partial [Gaiellaceae bacterium]|nr:cation diffusion facilitator family transporter [Gaiellaceae bacterium]
GSFLVLASLVIVWRAVMRLTSSSPPAVRAEWWTIAVIGVVVLVDAGRTVASTRAARRYGSAALASNALHFAGDLGGSLAVLAGLLLVRAGHPKADSVAALLVAVLVLAAAARLMRRNIDVLMDRVPADAAAAARTAIASIQPAIELRRLRMRQAAGRHFADVVIGVSPDAAVGQGHAAADAVERAVQAALPEADVVVHVEPGGPGGALRERAHAAALGVPRVREVHNVSAVAIDSGVELSLHLKLPAELSLEEAHSIASEVERAIRHEVPEVSSVQTHLEPLSEEAPGSRPAAGDVVGDRELVERIVREETGGEPRELRFLHTDEGLVAFLTLGLDGATPLAEAHAGASRIEERIRQERPQIADVIVHTEP